MEISGRILREVEFRDRLRGYDTDEVDEFLEKIALGVDELTAQLHDAKERVERAEHQAEQQVPLDDDSIRRTLVLAQRTADLAVKEAEAEAARLVEEAQSRADALVTEAKELAAKTRSEAEEDLRGRVERLRGEQSRLEHELSSLVGLVEQERSRLVESLGGLLSHITHLEVSRDVAAAAADLAKRIPAVEPAPAPPAPAPHEQGALADVLFADQGEDPVDLDDDLDLSFRLPDVERHVTEDASTATYEARSETPDPDEELWERWARSGENDVARSDDDSFPLGPRGES